jgi:hypothetical protein
MDLAAKFLENYSSFRAAHVSGRFLSYPELLPELQKLRTEFPVKEIGRSFLNVPVETIQLGNGPVKILGWSQMHGNETTTTKGIIDLLYFFSYFKNDKEVKEMLNRFTFLIIPMLNPDGAARYTRENVNKIDLNRDAQDIKEPESRILRACFEDFKPDYCFNLHDQRTIFGVGSKPATLSFLAPSMDSDCAVTETRKKAMKIIVAMNAALQEQIPGQVGRFDDSFNINCTGDYFQATETPTILFECGHFPGDYQREETRKLFAYSVLMAIENIVSGDFQQKSVEAYFAIPENEKNFYDIILRNAMVKGKKVDIALQYKEVMKSGEINFIPEVQKISPNIPSRGHREIECLDQMVENMDERELSENDIVEVILLNKEKLSIKSQ